MNSDGPPEDEVERERMLLLLHQLHRDQQQLLSLQCRVESMEGEKEELDEALKQAEAEQQQPCSSVNVTLGWEAVTEETRQGAQALLDEEWPEQPRVVRAMDGAAPLPCRFVALDASTRGVVGHAKLVRACTGSASDAVTGVVLSVVVAAGSRRHGTGTFIMGNLEEEARLRGLACLGLCTTPAVAPFYEACGYKVAPGGPRRRGARVVGCWHYCSLMVRRLCSVCYAVHTFSPL